MDHVITVIITVLLVVMAAIFSGLNISLMSLSIADLRRKAKLGNADAKNILPLRKNAYLSLASILFANVAVVSLSTLTLESAFNGVIAGVVTTILMVVFGELLPQAIFVKSALKFCSLFSPLIRIVIFVTYPLSKPLAMLLTRLMGKEKRALHTRAELGMLIEEHKIGRESELDEDEVEIIQSALMLSEKTIKDIMTPIDSVFWLPEHAVINAEMVAEIVRRGYSRIPVFNQSLTECRGVLLMKDMVNIDFTSSPVPVTDFRLHQTQLVGSRTALDTTFRKFNSLRSHLVPVERDDKVIGIITSEDLIEEILGHEISDETDRRYDRK